jgi:hypothetical protein
MKASTSTLAAISLAFAATFTFAQGGPGSGPGAGPGKGPGWRFNADTTPGWSLMTNEERVAHRQGMLATKTYDECKAYQDAHHRQMAERAKAKGATIPDAPRRDICDRMKRAGRLR